MMAKKTPRLRLVDTTFRDAQQSLLIAAEVTAEK